MTDGNGKKKLKMKNKCLNYAQNVRGNVKIIS